MNELKPGTAIIFEHNKKLVKGVVVKYSDDFIGSEEIRKKIKRKNLILVQVNDLRWVPKHSIKEVLGEDFWFNRYSNCSSTKVEKV